MPVSGRFLLYSLSVSVFFNSIETLFFFLNRNNALFYHIYTWAEWFLLGGYLLLIFEIPIQYRIRLGIAASALFMSASLWAKFGGRELLTDFDAVSAPIETFFLALLSLPVMFSLQFGKKLSMLSVFWRGEVWCATAIALYGAANFTLFQTETVLIKSGVHAWDIYVYHSFVSIVRYVLFSIGIWCYGYVGSDELESVRHY